MKSYAIEFIRKVRESNVQAMSRIEVLLAKMVRFGFVEATPAAMDAQRQEMRLWKNDIIGSFEQFIETYELNNNEI